MIGSWKSVLLSLALKVERSLWVIFYLSILPSISWRDGGGGGCYFLNFLLNENKLKTDKYANYLEEGGKKAKKARHGESVPDHTVLQLGRVF